MADDLDELIERLAYWRTSDDGYDSPSPRHRAIDALRERGPEVVPVLAGRLRELLAEIDENRRRADAVQRAWDAWYDEADRLRGEHGLGVDISRYSTISDESLPQPVDFTDPYDLRQGIIEALHRIGDERAAPALVAALGDRACVNTAARALRDVHSDQAVPALLDAAALVEPDRDLLNAFEHYGITLAQARRRFEAETSPQGRLHLMALLERLPDDGTGRPDPAENRGALAYFAIDDRDTIARWKALNALNQIDDPSADGLAIGMEDPPSAEVVRVAIVAAAHGRPPGYDLKLVRSITRIKGTLSGTRAVESLLTQESPEPDTEELVLALRLVLGANGSHLEDPVRLVGALHRLSSHAEVGARADFALRRHRALLFERMLHDDEAVRRRAQSLFDDIATPDDRTAFAAFKATRGNRLTKLLRRLKSPRS
ncbi:MULTISPECIES: HEAT repeat domain-containing protein [Actinomadura]|uniref:HEAT repeat domain-containing protein n=1 Tax=Actinomadura yumaensis TaxID=111807 RepID=A0ABW2CFD3_9ACTN|nr:HEAT repeat domain-containing protein [Actinomadura sp. J1-007]MWK34945.1 hypothetical protein [Actinomadura sp. J1-007]